jgi:hypothetical protein
MLDLAYKIQDLRGMAIISIVRQVSRSSALRKLFPFIAIFNITGATCALSSAPVQTREGPNLYHAQ